MIVDEIDMHFVWFRNCDSGGEKNTWKLKLDLRDNWVAKIPSKVGTSVNEKLDQHDQCAVLWNQESSDQGVKLLVMN